MHRQITKLSQFMQSLQDRLQKDLACSLSCSVLTDSSKEFYELSVEQDEIKLKGSLKTICYALNQLQVAARSQHFSLFLGPSTPRFGLRPLWLKKNPSNLFLKEEQLCEQLFKYGYNALILEIFLTDLSSEKLKSFCLFCQSQGIALYLHLSHQLALPPCPIDPGFKIYLQKNFRLLKELPYDGIVWESQISHSEFLKHSLADSLTEKEMVLEEIRGLESLIDVSKTLIYYLPAKNELEAEHHAAWLTFLTHRMGSQTIFAFSAVAGDVANSHLPLHPIWDVLQQLRDPLWTPLLPLFNGGCLNQGEGMWPVLNFEHLEEVLQKCQRHQFAGLAIVTKQLPQEKGLLSCNLWVCGQALWTSWSPAFLAQLWFKSERSDLDFKSFTFWLKRIAWIARELSQLKEDIRTKRLIQQPEMCRCKGESLLAQLSELHQVVQLEQTTPFIQGSCFKDYYLYFMRDARRLILLFMQTYQLPISTLLMGQDMQAAFWTEVSSSNDQVSRGQVKIFFKEEIQTQWEDPILQQIYEENFLI